MLLKNGWLEDDRFLFEMVLFQVTSVHFQGSQKLMFILLFTTTSEVPSPDAWGDLGGLTSFSLKTDTSSQLLRLPKGRPTLGFPVVLIFAIGTCQVQLGMYISGYIYCTTTT